MTGFGDATCWVCGGPSPTHCDSCATKRVAEATADLRRLDIPLARDIGRRLGADVIILARSESGQWAGASWGRTRERCGEIGRVMDRIFDSPANLLSQMEAPR